jgi:hypothetical protein
LKREMADKLSPVIASEKYSGRPGTMPLDDLWDRLEALFAAQEAKSNSKQKKFTKAVFLRQLPIHLEHEALQVWRKHRERILTPPSDDSADTWDPIEKVIKLFRKEFGVASADKVRELHRLKKGDNEICRMLKGRLERLADETGLLNEREKALAFVRALPGELQKQVTPVLYANSKGGQYTLEEAFEIAEKIDLATAYAEGLQGWQQGGTSALDERRGGGKPRGFARARVAAALSRHGGQSLLSLWGR